MRPMSDGLKNLRFTNRTRQVGMCVFITLFLGFVKRRFFKPPLRDIFTAIAGKKKYIFAYIAIAERAIAHGNRERARDASRFKIF